MKNEITKGLKESFTYPAYRKLVADYLTEGKSTGHIQSDAYLNYSKLGNARMKRLDKQFKLSDAATNALQNTSKKYTWLVLTEGWCGDAAHALPIMHRMAEASENIDLKIVLRDDNEGLMNHFLTNGSKSIPKLIALDTDTEEVLYTWGPRPSIATKMVDDHKEKYGSLDADFKQDLQVWYNSNKGENIEHDMIEML